MRTTLCLLVLIGVSGCAPVPDSGTWGMLVGGADGSAVLERGSVGGQGGVAGTAGPGGASVSGSGGAGGASVSGSGGAGGASVSGSGGAGGASSVQCAAAWPVCSGGAPQHRLAGCSVTADGFSIYKCGWNDSSLAVVLPCRFTDANLTDPSGEQNGVKVYGCVDEGTCAAVLTTHNTPGGVTGACP